MCVFCLFVCVCVYVLVFVFVHLSFTCPSKLRHPDNQHELLWSSYCPVPEPQCDRRGWRDNRRDTGLWVGRIPVPSDHIKVLLHLRDGVE